MAVVGGEVVPEGSPMGGKPAVQSTLGCEIRVWRRNRESVH